MVRRLWRVLGARASRYDAIRTWMGVVRSGEGGGELEGGQRGGRQEGRTGNQPTLEDPQVESSRPLNVEGGGIKFN